MAIYHDLDNTGQEVQQRLDQVPVTQADLAEEVLTRQAAVGAVQNNVDAIEEKIPSGASSSNKMATASDISSLDAAIEAILLLIPSAATSLNKLADKAFVNSSIATATATFRGTKNLVSDLNLAVDATHEQIAVALSEAVSGADNNDYAFVQVPTSSGTPTEIRVTERYKFDGTAWSYEYDLNNSGFTSDQWAAINSTITSRLVDKLNALPSNADLTAALGVLTNGIAAINEKIPTAATSSNKLVDTAAMQSYITQILDGIDATFNVTSTDGHVTIQVTQVNGVVTNVAVTTSDIASAADVAQLFQLYNALSQSEPAIIQPADTWPVANPSTTVIYRVIDRVNTPPQNYSDYMFSASDLTTPVLMATYNNAIDPRPKKGSQNLVTSGGVFDNMGALDVSELNATENPHTPAIYADLSAALAAITSDYQKGGMSIKFIQGSVQSNDNKYVQARCMAQNFTTDVTLWQGVDKTVKAGSKNLVESGGVAEVTDRLNNDVEGIDINESVSITNEAYVQYEYGDYHLYQGEVINITVSGNCYVNRFRIVNENGTILKDYMRYVGNTENYSFTVSEDSIKLYIVIHSVTTAGTLTIGMTKEGIKDRVETLELQTSELYDDVSVFDRTKALPSGTTVTFFDGLNIGANEEFYMVISSDVALSRLIISANVNTRLYDSYSPTLDNYIKLSNSTDVTKIMIYATHASSTANVRAVLYKNDMVKMLQIQDAINNLLESTEKSGSITFDSTGTQLLSDIYIPKGYRYKVKLSSTSSWTRMAIYDQSNTWPGVNAHDYLVNGQEYQFLSNADITKLKAVCLSAPSFPITVNYSVEVVSISDIINTIPQCSIPNKCYILKNSQKTIQNSIYYKTIFNWLTDNFVINNTSSAWKYLERCVRNYGDASAFSLSLCDLSTLMDIYSVVSSTVVSDVAIDNGLKKINIIGDSLTYNGTWYQHIYELCQNLSFVGMRRSAQVGEDLRAEGRGGWKLDDYMTKAYFTNHPEYGFSPLIHPSGYKYYGVTGFWKRIVNDNKGADTYNLNGYDDYKTWFDTDGKKVSPQSNDMMYDSDNNVYIYFNGTSWVNYNGTPTFVIDYAKYLEVWDIQSPDFVLIYLGTNDFADGYNNTIGEQFAQQCDDLINSILDYATANSKTIIIGICTNPVIASLPNQPNSLKNPVFSSRNLWNGRKKVIDTFNNSTYENKDVYLIDTAAVLDPDYGYMVEYRKPFEYYEGDEVEMYDVNSVHPSAEGYKQIGTCVAGFIQNKR